MQADAVSLLKIFETKMRLEVPLFQRQYVWEQEKHWLPLWEDLARKFHEYLDGRLDAPVHFLGAIVLDQKQTPTTHVEKRQIIDGQQRLSTFQIFLAALRDLARAHGALEVADELESFTRNKGLMSNPDVEKYKVWPSQVDRPFFMDVISAGSRTELEARHPPVRRKYVRRPDPRPRMVEAYLYFYDCLTDFFLGTESDAPLHAQLPLAARLEQCLQALRNGLQVVVIDLENADDPQVIFETLNARGEPLLPADLLRNYIFLRAARREEGQEELYARYWQQFDDAFWRKEIKQGRLVRPRSDLFLQHYLASRVLADIPVKNLFVEYKFWIERAKPFETVESELAALARQGQHFRRILAAKPDDPLHPLVTFLDAFDMRTAYPFLLTLLDLDTSPDAWRAISQHLESYLLRRAVCGLTSQNLNRVFINVTRAARRGKTTPDNVAQELLALTGDSVLWPTDAHFRDAWMTRHIYQLLQNPRVVHILKRLNTTWLGPKGEDVSIHSPLTVEHIMPQNWHEHWPLADGSPGLTHAELETRPDEDPLVIATRHRNQLVQTLGNLTIITTPLNSSISNDPWSVKRPQLLENSLLPINHHLRDYADWDETTIAARGAALFERACQLWPRPRPQTAPTAAAP